MTGTLTSEMAYLAADGFGVAIRDEPGEIILTVHGEADIATAPMFSLGLSAACEAGNARVVLNLTALTFIDAGCVGLLAGTRRHLRDQDRDLIVRSPSPFVHRVLVLCGIKHVIDLL